MKTFSKLAAALVISAFAHGAHAGMLNDQVKVDYLFPTVDTLYAPIGQGTVDADGLQLRFWDYFTVDIRDRKITVDYLSNATWSMSSFNGFALTNLSNNLSQFAIGNGTNMAGFGAGNVSVVNNVLYVNWESLSFNQDTQVVLDLQDAPSDVPEPMSVALLGLGLAGLAASRRLRK